MNPGEISPDSSEVAVRNFPGASDLHERDIGSYEVSIKLLTRERSNHLKVKAVKIQQ